MKFSYYDGNIRKSDCIGYITIEQFINVHKDPTIKTKNLLNDIKKATKNGDLELKKELKKGLFAFTPSVFICKGQRRKYDNISGWTGLMQLDFDKIPDEETAKALKNHLFDAYESIICCYISPSGKGVKCLMRTVVPKDIHHYRFLHKAVSKEMEQYGYFDEATKNAILPLFLSADKEILYRDVKPDLAWRLEDRTVVEYVNLNDIPKQNYEDQQLQKYYEKTVQLITDKINSIGSDGHPQLRSAALILGSRCGAGYIDRAEAEQLITNLIYNNSYLQKDVKNYIKTAMWAINQGTMNAKYY